MKTGKIISRWRISLFPAMWGPEYSAGQALQAITFNGIMSVDMVNSPGSSGGPTAPWWGRRTWRRPSPGQGCPGWWSCCQICPELERSSPHFGRGLCWRNREGRWTISLIFFFFFGALNSGWWLACVEEQKGSSVSAASWWANTAGATDTKVTWRKKSVKTGD